MRNKKLPGFMGRTHVLFSLVLLGILMLIPIPFLKEIFDILKSNILLFIVAITVYSGAALLPDLDNTKSSAGSTLGVFGSMISLFMTSTASAMWNIYHLKGDRKPNNFHRYLWHCPIIGISLILLFSIFLPKEEITIINAIKQAAENEGIGIFIIENTVLLLFILLAFSSVFTGANMLLFRLGKLVYIPNIVKYIFPFAVSAYIIAAAPFNHIRILGIFIGLGYLFHCLEDFLVDSGICLLWPIPAFWKNQAWKKFHLPLGIKTGGTINTILDFVLLPIMILVFVLALR